MSSNKPRGWSVGRAGVGASGAAHSKKGSLVLRPLTLPLSPSFVQVLSRHLPGAAAFHAAWPGVLCGTDAHGHLVWLEALKDVDVEALSALSYDQLVRHRMQAMEALEAAKRACAPCGRLYRKHIYILDCRGVSPGLFLNGAARRVIKTMSAVCSDYYTETLWRCYLVHTSPAARFMWAALRPLLHPDTAAKVRLCGGPGDFHKAMEKEGLPVSALPPVLGGSFDPAVPLYDNILAAIRDAQRPARAFLRDDSARQLGTHEDELLQSRPLHKGWMTTPQPLTLLRMRA